MAIIHLNSGVTVFIRQNSINALLGLSNEMLYTLVAQGASKLPVVKVENPEEITFGSMPTLQKK